MHCFCRVRDTKRMHAYVFVSVSPAEGAYYTRRQKAYRTPSCQKATALAAATFRESTPWDMGMRTV